MVAMKASLVLAFAALASTESLAKIRIARNENIVYREDGTVRSYGSQRLLRILTRFFVRLTGLVSPEPSRSWSVNTAP